MFQVGDEVTIREDLREGQYGADVANNYMLGYAGLRTRVIELNERGFLLEGCGTWTWTPEMVIPAVKRKPEKLNPPQRITFSRGDKTLEESVKSAIKSIRSGYYGGTYLKLELEAQLDRGSSHGECGECGGEGGWDCENSHENLEDDDGEIVDDQYEESCEYCSDNWVRCPDCNGDGNYGDNQWDDGECQNLITEHVSDACREATVYSNFVYDGSVDSEFNFTVPLSWEGLGYAIEYIEAFKALADEIGNGLDTRGAGMHITILRSEDGNYPNGNKRFDSRALDKFTKNMNKLMPALLLLASENHKSRPLNYRMPQVRIDSHSHAISGAGHSGAFEWRIFETCYKRPEMLYDFICVIAKGLKFYHPKARVIDLGIRIGTLEFLDSHVGDGLHKYFHTEKHLKVMRSGLRYLLPDHRTARQTLALRNFKLSAESLKRRESRLASQLEAQWLEEKAKIPTEKEFVERQMKYYPRMDLESFELEELDTKLREEYRKTKLTKKAYMKRQIKQAIAGGYHATYELRA